MTKQRNRTFADTFPICFHLYMYVMVIICLSFRRGNLAILPFTPHEGTFPAHYITFCVHRRGSSTYHIWIPSIALPARPSNIASGKWDASKPANQGRIVEVMVEADGGWALIDPAASYSVVSNNYVRGGGDGYDVFADNARNVYDYGPNVESVVADYLSANAPYAPKLEGRISQ